MRAHRELPNPGSLQDPGLMGSQIEPDQLPVDSPLEPEGRQSSSTETRCIHVSDTGAAAVHELPQVSQDQELAGLYIQGDPLTDDRPNPIHEATLRPGILVRTILLREIPAQAIHGREVQMDVRIHETWNEACVSLGRGCASLVLQGDDSAPRVDLHRDTLLPTLSIEEPLCPDSLVFAGHDPHIIPAEVHKAPRKKAHLLSEASLFSPLLPAVLIPGS